MAIADFFFGKPERTKKVPTLAPEQQQFLNQILSQLMQTTPGAFQYIQDLLSESPEAAERFGAPARREFQEQIVPQLAERFAGVGGLSSSGFQQALGQAGAGLAERLTAMREGLRPGALSALSGLGQLGLGTQTFQQQRIGGQPGFLQSLPQIGGILGRGLLGGLF